LKKDPIHIEKYNPSKPRLKAGDRNMEGVIRNMASCGLGDKEIAKFVGTKLSQLKKRLKEIPTLEAALVYGRSEATQKMVAQVFQVAMGGMVTQKVKERINARGETSIEIVTEEHPPNPQMMMFWLTNTAPDAWKYSRQLIKEDAQGLDTDGKTLESDKIARLSREIFESNTDGAERKHIVSEETAHAAGEGTLDEGDLRADVQGKAADNIQDDVLDVSTETGTVAIQAPAV
jgi:hypothetical protein